MSTQLQVDHEFFHLLDLTVLNSWILLSLCGAKCTHRDFRFLLVRNLIEEAGKSQDRTTPSLVGRPSAVAANVMGLDSRYNKHWPEKCSKLRCRVCSARGKRSGTAYKCAKCNVSLCVAPCFADYHKNGSVNLAFTTSVCVVTEERPKVPQNLYSSQNYVLKQTLHFIYCVQ